MTFGIRNFDDLDDCICVQKSRIPENSANKPLRVKALHIEAETQKYSFYS